MNARFEAHSELRAHLANLDDAGLVRLLGSVNPTPGWGNTRTLTIGNHRVFAKSLPLTDLEREHPYSTKNRYDLPAFYNYGVGSAGFGAFRELAAHMKTTEWVLSDAIGSFPIMYHHRIVPKTADFAKKSPDRLDSYIEFWDGSPEIRRYLNERNAASFELVMFLEYVPFVLQSWLGQNLDRLDTVVDDVTVTIAFLRDRGIVHFDANLANILTDGNRVYLADFGLVLDDAYELSTDERRFLARHRHFDEGEFIVCLMQPLEDEVANFTEETRAVITALCGDAEPGTVLTNLEAVVASGNVDLPENYVASLVTHREIIGFMDGFFARLKSGPKADANYDDAELVQLLAARSA